MSSTTTTTHPLHSTVATMTALAGPAFAWNCSRPGHRPTAAARRGLRVFLAEYAGFVCTACGAATPVESGEVCHIVSRGPGRRGFLPGNLFWGCSACNATQKVAGEIVDVETLDAARVPMEFPSIPFLTALGA